MKHFALIGAAGFIATRHMRAIRDTGNTIVCALDPFDSVGVLDSYFPDADFFTEFERFDRHIEKLRMRGLPVDYVSICSPNYLHDSHIRFGLRNQSDVICEKPLVLNPWNIDSLVDMQARTGRKVYNILQLRLHPAIIALREKVRNQPDGRVHDVELTYITSAEVVLYQLEGRHLQVRRHRHQHRRAFLRHADMDIRTCPEEHRQRPYA